MKNILYFLPLVLVLTSCFQDDLPSQTYYMFPANLNSAKGTVTFTELESGAIQVDIDLEKTVEGVMHPAHLHFGDVSEVGELAFALNDVDGSTGKSSTVLDHVELSNGDVFTLDQLSVMNGSVKIHMNKTYFSDRVLCFGNVGTNEQSVFTGVAICTGH